MDASLALALATFVFWVLCGAVIFLPPRMAVLAYVLLAQFDITGSDFESATMVGFANIIKILVLPTLLYLRLRDIPATDTPRPAFSKLWLLFAGYVAFASLWTQFHLPALKMVGFLYAYTLLFLIFVKGWRAGWFNGKVFSSLAWATLGLGTIQTYFLGDFFGSPGDDYSKQFTTFIGAQSLAPFLLALFIFVFLYEERKLWRVFTCLALFLAIVLDGSRYILGAAVVSFFILAGGNLLIRRSRHVFAMLTAGVICTVLLSGITVWSVLKYAPRSRINEFSEAVITGHGSLEDIADFAWRLMMYQEVGHDLQTRGSGLLLVGSGTSSATVVRNRLDYWHDEDVSDANRVVHNEFLRSLYEWGLCGFSLLSLFVAGVLGNSLKTLFRGRSRGALACLAFFPAMFLGLAIENVLVGSGAPDGVAYALALSCLAFSQIRTDEKVYPAHAVFLSNAIE